MWTLSLEFFGLFLTAGVGAVSLPQQYLWLQPWLLSIAGFGFFACCLSLSWPVIKWSKGYMLVSLNNGPAFVTLNEALEFKKTTDQTKFLAMLRDMCGRSKIKAFGIKNGVGNIPEPIPSNVWSSHKLDLDLGGCAVPENADDWMMGQIMYADKHGQSKDEVVPEYWRDLRFTFDDLRKLKL